MTLLAIVRRVIMDRLIKATDVAELLNVRPATVYALVQRGVLPHVRISEGAKRPLLRFRLTDIERFLCTRTVVREKS